VRRVHLISKYTIKFLVFLYW